MKPYWKKLVKRTYTPYSVRLNLPLPIEPFPHNRLRVHINNEDVKRTDLNSHRSIRVHRKRPVVSVLGEIWVGEVWRTEGGGMEV